MRLAFDARVRPHSSFARVLRLYQEAARAAGLGWEEWSGGACTAEFLWILDPGEVRPQSHGEVQRGTRLVVTLHDVNPLLPDGRPWIARLRRETVFRGQVKSALRHVSGIATDSRHAEEQILRHFPAARGRLGIVPLFADPRLAPDDPGEVAMRLADHGLPTRYLLFLGALRRHKNWETLLRAYGQLPQALRRDFPLLLAGRADRARRRLPVLLRELRIEDDVRVLDEVSDALLPDLYRGASLFVFPSLLEGFGLPPLEAMACGTPVIASDASCLPEVLGEAPLYFPAQDPRALAQRIDGLLGDRELAATLRRRGIAQAASYGPERTGRAMRELLERAGGT